MKRWKNVRVNLGARPQGSPFYRIRCMNRASYEPGVRLAGSSNEPGVRLRGSPEPGVRVPGSPEP